MRTLETEQNDPTNALFTPSRSPTERTHTEEYYWSPRVWNMNVYAVGSDSMVYQHFSPSKSWFSNLLQCRTALLPCFVLNFLLGWWLMAPNLSHESAHPDGNTNRGARLWRNWERAGGVIVSLLTPGWDGVYSNMTKIHDTHVECVWKFSIIKKNFWL